MIHFVSKSREPYGFVPFARLDLSSDDSSRLQQRATATIGGHSLNDAVRSAIAIKLTHWIVPIMSFYDCESDEFIFSIPD